MNEQLQNDLNKIDILLETVKLQGLEYLKNIDTRPTSAKHDLKKQEHLNEVGTGAFEALKKFNDRFEPIMVASSGPRYLGFVIGGATPASIVGDWLTSIYDQNPQAIKGQGDNSALIETETIQFLLELLDLPEDFLGGFVTGATMSNFTSLAIARQWIGRTINKDFAKDGISGNIKILTANPHSSTIKSLSMLGIGSNNFQQINTLEGNREAIDITDLERKIKQLNEQPFILISSAGTVNTADFDDFQAISRLKEKYNFWWHIDAAFGAFASCSPSYKYLLNGWELADSITVDCHKWLNVPYESAVFLVKKKHSTLQTETFQNSNAPYLGNPFDNFNYLNFLPENSRRLKALPTWFSLIAYGKDGYRDIVENSIALANRLGKYIEESDKFELLAPVRLNNVCFSSKNTENQDKILTFLTKLNDTGTVFMTPTIFKNRKGIRASFVNWRTTVDDVDLIISELKKIKM